MTVGLFSYYLLSWVLRVSGGAWLALVGTVPSALLLMLMFSLPETSRWFLGKNRRREALRALHWLRGLDADIEEKCSKQLLEGPISHLCL